jgi:hypothetical protein
LGTVQGEPTEIANAREERKMISQIRIHTINKGEMDNFLKRFKEEIMPLHEKIGVPIVGSWVNRPQNEFIWVRTYKDKGGARSEDQGVPSCGRGRWRQAWRQRREDGSARGRIGVCVEKGSEGKSLADS